MQHWSPRDPYAAVPLPVRGLLATLEEHSAATLAHAERVAQRAAELARFAAGPAQERIAAFQTVGLLHDLGKLTVPRRVLHKPGPLAPSEWESLRLASLCGSSLLRPFFAPGEALVDALRAVHERWDGGGWPDGLAGSQIPEAARVVAIADAFDALTHDRADRAACPPEAALQILRAAAGSQFDPGWVTLAARCWGRPGQAGPAHGAWPAPGPPSVFLHNAGQVHRGPSDDQDRRAA